VNFASALTRTIGRSKPMTQADSVHSTPPTNTSATNPPGPVDPTRRRLLTIAAGSIAGFSPAIASALPDDPIFAAIKRHRAASIVWNAAVDVRADFPEGRAPLTDEEREQCDLLDDAVAAARDTLEQTGVNLIGTVPTTVGGIASAIAYIQRQMRDDGTFMPFDIEFQFDDGYAGDGGVVLGWIDAFLNTMAVAVSELDVGKAMQS
jgi:hypothetical protein